MSGITGSESNREYHADHAYVGSTMLNDFRKSPSRFKGLYIDHTIECDPPSLDMILGSITHCLVGGFSLDTEFLVTEGCKRRDGKAWDSYVEQAEKIKVTPILPAQVDLGKLLADKILTNPLSRKFFECDGPAEQSIRWESNGVLCKCKPDKLVIDPYYDCLLCPDIKTTSAESIAEFDKDAWGYEYQCSSAMYLEGINSIPEYAEQSPQFVYVVVFKHDPYDVAVLAVEQDGLFYRKGKELHQDTLCRLKWARENDNWLLSGVDDGREISRSGLNRIQSIKTPAWVRE